MNIINKIIIGLQLDHKWVRVMLIISAILILGIIFYPNTESKLTYKSSTKESKIILDTTRIDIEKSKGIERNDFEKSKGIERNDFEISKSIEIIGNDTIVHNQIRPAPTMSRPNNRTIAGVQDEPIQVLQEAKPLDWKGTITWIIGAINGLVLVVLNVKNLIIKKTP